MRAGVGLEPNVILGLLGIVLSEERKLLLVIVSCIKALLQLEWFILELLDCRIQIGWKTNYQLGVNNVALRGVGVRVWVGLVVELWLEVGMQLNMEVGSWGSFGSATAN